jgi:ABC-2 type transport system permease protein
LLNPVLMMLIQYVVFSTLFKSSIENFPVYLLSGMICFSYFSESTTTGLSSISGNANLISKVYIPKYIFPLSRVLSSGINFLFSLIPLFAVTLISGLPITRAYLFLPFIFLCLFMLCLGIAMLLSAIMVFFRDIQFLWSVITMLLMYATPLFYPESIIPVQFIALFRMNPLYHIIRLFRVVIMDGVPPMPKAVIVCLAICTAIFGLGAFVFKKEQDKFILNI